MLRSRWDWYSATIDDLEEGQMAGSLALMFGASVVPGRSRNGYAICQEVTRHGNVLASVFERSAREGEVHVQITSDACDDVVPVLRDHWPLHRVTRADSAVDFGADFGPLDAQLVDLAERRGISHRLFTSSDGGATRYLGSPRSETQLRFYKKSEQLRAIHPDRAADIDDGIVRFEVTSRPAKRAAKEAMSVASPDDAWGFSKWSQEVALLILGIESERTRTHFRKPTDDERSLHFLVEQYGPLLRRRAAQRGVEASLAELAALVGLEAAYSA